MVFLTGLKNMSGKDAWAEDPALKRRARELTASRV